MKLIEVLSEALEEARRAAQESLRKGVRTLDKGAYGDVSYTFDVDVESAVVEVLRSRLGDVVIASEEMGVKKFGNPKYYVVIDPVDGSKNAARGLPFYSTAITIARGEKIRDIVAAGVINLVSGERFLGEVGGDVIVDGGKPRLSRVRKLSDAFIFLDHGSFRPEGRGWALKIMDKAKDTRFFSSAALELAQILKGRADAFVCLGRTLRFMDFIASAFLLQLSGGYYQVIGGDEDSSILSGERVAAIAASTHQLLDEILSVRG